MDGRNVEDGRVQNTAGNNNSNSKIFESDSQGIVTQNSNSVIRVTNSQIDVQNNRNCHIETKVVPGGSIDENSNGNFMWANSAVTISNNRNSKIHGDARKEHKDFTFLGNSNMNFVGFRMFRGYFERNSNIRVQMREGGEVTAVGNSNISISGGIQNLYASGLTNYQIKSIDTRNRFEVIDQDRGWFSSWVGWNKAPNVANLRYEVDYVGEAQLKKDSGSVGGGFNWTLHKGENKIQMNLGQNEASWESRQLGPNSILITSNNQQNLVVKGPNPVSINGNVISLPLGIYSQITT